MLGDFRSSRTVMRRSADLTVAPRLRIQANATGPASSQMTRTLSRPRSREAARSSARSWVATRRRRHPGWTIPHTSASSPEVIPA